MFVPFRFHACFEAVFPRARQAVLFRRALAFAVLGLSVAAPAAAVAQGLIYERPFGYGHEEPSEAVPRPRGMIRHVMLPPAEVQRRLRSVGFEQVARPELSGQIYFVTAVDAGDLVRLTLDAYSGEILKMRFLGRAPAAGPRVPVAPQRPRPTPDASQPPLPPARPVETAVMPADPPSGQVPAPAPVPASTGAGTVTPGSAGAGTATVSSTPAP